MIYNIRYSPIGITDDIYAQIEKFPWKLDKPTRTWPVQPCPERHHIGEEPTEILIKFQFRVAWHWVIPYN